MGAKRKRAVMGKEEEGRKRREGEIKNRKEGERQEGRQRRGRGVIKVWKGKVEEV